MTARRAATKTRQTKKYLDVFGLRGFGRIGSRGTGLIPITDSDLNEMTSRGRRGTLIRFDSLNNGIHRVVLRCGAKAGGFIAVAQTRDRDRAERALVNARRGVKSLAKYVIAA